MGAQVAPGRWRLALERLPSLTDGELHVWMRALTPVASWPAGEPARPSLERRFWRNTARGRLTETITLVLNDPLGVLDGAAADRELTELARPLRDRLALRTLSAARAAAFDAMPYVHFTELAHLDRATSDVRPVLFTMFEDLLEGLAAHHGPVALSFIASPPAVGEEDEEDDEPDDHRHLGFHVTLAGQQPIPAALRARVEALCCSAPTRAANWQVSEGAASVEGYRVMLRAHDLSNAAPTSMKAVVAAVTMGAAELPNASGTLVGRPVPGPLPTSGVPLGRVPRPGGQLVPWRLDWGTRTHHVLLTGGTGAGKSTMIKRLVFDDVEHGRGVVVLDPHGDLAQELAGVIAGEAGTLYVDPREPHSQALDVFHPDPRRADVAVQSAMAELWPPEFTGPVFQRHVAVALRVLAAAGYPLTMVALDLWFSSATFRKEQLAKVADPELVSEANPLHGSLLKPSTDDLPMSNYLASKFSPFAQGPARTIFDRSDPITWEERVARGDACVVCLPTGMLGDAGVRMAGRVLLTRLTQALAAQGERPAADRRPFSIVIDEAHLFAGQALAGLYTQVRKFGGSVTAATQAPSQLGRQRDLILSNVATVVSGRLSRVEAAALHDRAGDATVAALPKLPRWHMMAMDAEHDAEVIAPILTPLPLPDGSRAHAAVHERAAGMAPDERRTTEDPGESDSTTDSDKRTLRARAQDDEVERVASLFDDP